MAHSFLFWRFIWYAAGTTIHLLVINKVVHMKSQTLLTLLLSSAMLVGCGGGSSSDGVSQSNVSFGFSDFPVEGAESVVVTVDALSFVGPDGEVTEVDTFTSTDLNITDADTFQFDLLDVQGDDFRLVLDSVSLPVGEYSELRIDVIDENTEVSYVEELGTGEIRELKVPSNQLKLGGFVVEERSTQTFIVEFDLRQAMTYNPGPQRYILKPRGIRVVGLEQAAMLLGNVNVLDFANTAPCAEKDDVSLGNAMYLYSGHDLNADLLADNFDPAVDNTAPVDAIAPYASAALGETGDYLFSFVEPGEYTLAFSCDAASDDPEQFEEIVIPAPVTEVVELTLAEGEDANCNFPLTDGVCATSP